MGEGLRQRIHGAPLMSTREEDYDELFDSDDFSSDCDSEVDERSAEEDATCSSSAGSSPPSSDSSSPPKKLSANGPLCELSSLMEQLPIKRGLSNYYHGKSQSFTSLAEVNCVEDLPKKTVPFNRRMKPCKSYAGGLDRGHCRSPSERAPGDAMPKKPPPPRVASCAALMTAGGTKQPALPAQKSVFFTLK